MQEQIFDYGIIGSGPAGHTAAFIAAKQGFSVILFEKDELGGVCLNRGCIPTKTILHSVELYNEVKNAENIGIETSDIKLNLSKIMERKDKVVETLRKGIEQGIKANKITYVNAEAKVLDEKTIEADGKKYNCTKIIAATGSTPKELKGLEFDHKFIVDSDDLFKITEIPKNVAIVGAGAEGIEWARIFKCMGAEVTLIEKTHRLLPPADMEVSKRLERNFKQQGIKFYTSTTIEEIKDIQVKLSNGEKLEPDYILIAAGRNVTRLNTDAKITYLGDAYGSIMLATFAMYQARALLSDIIFDNVFIPSVVYGTPEIAWIGANEQDLPNGSYEKIVYPLTALGKAYCDNATDGFVKILTYQDYVIGAHIIGKEASALIHELAVAMQNNIKVSDLKKVCFAHPTYSEAIYESILRL